MVDLLKDEGWGGFFKGLNARMIYCCAYGVLWMPIYDYFKGSYGANLDFWIFNKKIKKITNFTKSYNKLIINFK